MKNFIYPDHFQAIGLAEELRYLFASMLKSPRRSINPDRSIKKFKNTRKLCGVDFSHEVNILHQIFPPTIPHICLGLFGIRYTFDRSYRTCR